MWAFPPFRTLLAGFSLAGGHRSATHTHTAHHACLLAGWSSLEDILRRFYVEEALFSPPPPTAAFAEMTPPSPPSQYAVCRQYLARFSKKGLARRGRCSSSSTATVVTVSAAALLADGEEQGEVVTEGEGALRHLMPRDKCGQRRFLKAHTAGIVSALQDDAQRQHLRVYTPRGGGTKSPSARGTVAGP